MYDLIEDHPFSDFWQTEPVKPATRRTYEKAWRPGAATQGRWEEVWAEVDGA